jgi:hypothetical protein
MSTKTIVMSCHDSNRGHVNLTQTFDEDTSWSAIAYQFHKFLVAQGYVLDHDHVGADVEAFIMATEQDEE